MKNSNKPVVAIMVFLFLLSSLSCKKESQQFIGQWKFEKVTFCKNGSWNVEDVSAGYAGNLLQLKEDNTLIYTKAGIQSAGSWKARSISYTDPQTERDVTDYSLYLYFSDGITIHSTDYYTTKRNFKINESRDNGIYTYYLSK